MSLVNTGIEDLDRIFGGGLPNGSVILLLGEPGSGHDIFSQQILYSQAHSGKCKATYITVERSYEDVASDMLTYGWDVKPLLQDEKWVFIDGYTARLNIRRGAVSKRILLDLIKEGLSSMMEDGRWTIVDTFSYLMHIYELNEILGLLDALVVEARKYGGLHFLLGVHGFQEEEKLTAVAHFTDGLFDFSLRAEEAEVAGSIMVRKLRRTHHTLRSIPYRITSSGIIVETAVRIA